MSLVRAHRSGVRIMCSTGIYKKGTTDPCHSPFFFTSLCLHCTGFSVGDLSTCSRSGLLIRVQRKKDKKVTRRKKEEPSSSTRGPGPGNLTVMECDKVGVKGQVHECGGHRERVVAGEMLWTPQGGLSDAPRSIKGKRRDKATAKGIG